MKKNQGNELKTVIIGILETCDIHAERLQWAMTHLKKFIPITPQKIEVLAGEDVAIFELFISRFSKLQDLMGAQLFPAIIKLTEEPRPPKAFIDIINRLEKIEALPSANQWSVLRDIRNGFAHDYPEDSKENTDVLNSAFQHAHELLEIYEYQKKFIQKYLN